MSERIIICGGNGAGKSTLGKYLAARLECKFMDIEDYYFPRNSTEAAYPYGYARPRKEAIKDLCDDMKRHENFVLAATSANYEQEIEQMLTCAIFLNVPLVIRLRRVRERSLELYGDRILAGGDLFEKEETFFRMVEERPVSGIQDWLYTLRIPQLVLDGTKSKEHNTNKALCFLHGEKISQHY